ncbi:MAG: hypothetical protein L3J23_09545 [Flavobacteriaceae bacterium]|nr:hypothetical protein [Flavobacteriaceae bacterium]
METINELKELEEKVGLGLQEAYRKMVVVKKQKNSPLVVSRNGKIVKIKPEDIPATTTSKT